jgi:glycosyltransferase involved in cell wall biosynthesis
MSQRELIELQNKLAQALVGQSFGEGKRRHYRMSNFPFPPYGTDLTVPEILRIMWVNMSSVQAAGYGQVGLNMEWALQENGVEIMDNREFGWDFKVFPTNPHSWLVSQDGSIAEDTVILTTFDGDLLPDNWVRILNRAGAVWSPSQWNKEVFERSGVTRPIMVAGYGIMPDVFNWVDRDFYDGPFTFLAWGGRVFDRKNVMTTVKVFGKLNLPDCRLVVKLSTGRIKNIQSDRDIRVYNQDLEDWELAMFLYHSHCLVYPSSAEGFGLMPLEAMACGLPVILTDYSGMQEYMTPKTCIPLRVGEIVDAGLTNKMFRSEARWAKPDEDDLADKMIWVYEHRDEAKEIGRRASEYILNNWTWLDAGARAKTELLRLKNGY